MADTLDDWQRYREFLTKYAEAVDAVLKTGKSPAKDPHVQQLIDQKRAMELKLGIVTLTKSS